MRGESLSKVSRSEGAGGAFVDLSCLAPPSKSRDALPGGNPPPPPPGLPADAQPLSP